jgi:hypothetical protein
MNWKFLWIAPLIGLQIFAGPRKEIAEGSFFAPPTPPPIERRDAVAEVAALHSAATVYSIGDPTPEEQLYVEMLNRSRANPIAESQIFSSTTDADVLANYRAFSVDLALMQAQFALIPTAPPVALNAQLTAAARRHTGDMLTNSFQGHTGTDGSTAGQRITAAGYNWSTIGENVYSHVRSVFHGHAGFEVDWGPGPGGMQTPPGHRNTIHNAGFREVGVGGLFGTNSPAPGSTVPGSDQVGPQLVTQEFGTRQGATPLITGVVYFDLNENNFYDLGEGIGGVQVAASGTATTAVTARSGGYALPVVGNGTYTMTFTGDGLSSFSRQVTVSGAQNQKLDFLPIYTAPVVTGPGNPVVNSANNYQISPVPMATAYQWRSYQLITPAVEGAENGTSKVTIQTVGSYNAFETATKKSGSFSFHLAHPGDGIEQQVILLNPSYVVNANSALRFASRLGWATEFQAATVQVSTNNGSTWQNTYSQSGARTAGETAFQDRSLSLAAFAGSTIRIRFNYVPSGLVFTDTDFETGWFIDNITLENASEIGNEQVNDAVNGAFAFRPTVVGDFVLQARARTGHEFLPWGPSLAVQSREGMVNPPELRFSGMRVTNGQIEMEVDLVAGSAPSALALETKSSLTSPWTPATANVQAVSATRFRVTVPATGSATGFYRVKAN